MGVTAGLLASIVGGVAAHAAEKALGNITCSQFKEIHSISTSKGDVRHEIYGAWQLGAMWPVTSSISVGYSSTYTAFDAQHWLFNKNESGGRVKGSSGVTSGSLQCR
jgi:hypothetical protein